MKITIDFSNYSSAEPKVFNRKKECENWLYDGLFGTEGAENEHYRNMLAEFRSGKKVLHY